MATNINLADNLREVANGLLTFADNHTNVNVFLTGINPFVIIETIDNADADAVEKGLEHAALAHRRINIPDLDGMPNAGARFEVEINLAQQIADAA
jgi:hypothetical protein